MRQRLGHAQRWAVRRSSGDAQLPADIVSSRFCSCYGCNDCNGCNGCNGLRRSTACGRREQQVLELEIAVVHANAVAEGQAVEELPEEPAHLVVVQLLPLVEVVQQIPGTMWGTRWSAGVGHGVGHGARGGARGGARSQAWDEVLQRRVFHCMASSTPLAIPLGAALHHEEVALRRLEGDVETDDVRVLELCAAERGAGRYVSAWAACQASKSSPLAATPDGAAAEKKRRAVARTLSWCLTSR